MQQNIPFLYGELNKIVENIPYTIKTGEAEGSIKLIGNGSVQEAVVKDFGELQKRFDSNLRTDSSSVVESINDNYEKLTEVTNELNTTSATVNNFNLRNSVGNGSIAQKGFYSQDNMLENDSPIARGVNSVAMGKNSEANSDISFAFGDGVKTNRYGQTVVGTFNDFANDVNSIFAVGVGTLSNPKTAFSVLDDGRVKSFNEPIDKEDVARLQEIDALRTYLDSKFESDAIFDKNLTVKGDLTVSGTSTLINSENLSVKDNFILTNSNQVSLVDLSGLVINKDNVSAYGIVLDPQDELLKLGLGKVDENGTFTFLPGQAQALATRNYVDKLNLENGEGAGSLRQKDSIYDGESIQFSDGTKGTQTGALVPGSTATGFQSAAFGGLRYDYVDPTAENSYWGRTPTSAEGNQSFAAGGSSHAYGDWSVSLGKDNSSYNRGSVTLGAGNTAGKEELGANENMYAIALGDSNTAKNRGSVAIGGSNETTYAYAVAAGYSNKASSQAAIALGHKSISAGQGSLAAGCNVQALRDGAISLGYANGASGKGISRGVGTVAMGVNCVAGGDDSKGNYYGATAIGFGAAAYDGGTVALGKYNNYVPDVILMVGNGNDEDSRSNAFEVLLDGRARAYGKPLEQYDLVRLSDVTTNLLNGEGIDSIVQKTIEDQPNHAFGTIDIALGKNNTVYQNGSHAIGGSLQAGMSEEEFNSFYWSDFLDDTHMLPDTNGHSLNDGQGLSNGKVTDWDGKIYSESWSWSFVTGEQNINRGRSSAILSGGSSRLDGRYCAVLAGVANHIHSSLRSVITGGYVNNITDSVNSAILGGVRNQITGAEKSTVVNGENNVITSNVSIIGNGNNNKIDGGLSGILTGQDNIISSTAYGSAIFAGASNNVSGTFSGAAGYGNEIKTGNSFGFGFSLKTSEANPAYQDMMLVGRYNLPNQNALFQVGNGSSETDRRNAFEVLRDGRASIYVDPISEYNIVNKSYVDRKSKLYLVTSNFKVYYGSINKRVSIQFSFYTKSMIRTSEQSQTVFDVINYIKNFNGPISVSGAVSHLNSSDFVESYESIVQVSTTSNDTAIIVVSTGSATGGSYQIPKVNTEYTTVISFDIYQNEII